MVSKALDKYLAWWLLALILTIPLLTWIFYTTFPITSFYQIFPILGLIAWCFMWGQYVNGAVRIMESRQTLTDKIFTEVSEKAVLVLIFLHLFLFLLQRFIDTGYIPPISYASYVGEDRSWLIVIAFIALVAFLTYDVTRKYRNKLRQLRLWRYVSLAQVAAMILIFLHALYLGNYMTSELFRIWWIVVNILLLPCFVIHLLKDFKKI